MKYIALLLLLLTFGVSIMPCCVEEESSAMTSMDACCAIEKVHRESDKDCSDEKEEHRPCSPFFSCGSCAGSVPQPTPPEVAYYPKKWRRERVGYTKVVATQEIMREDWKPPQLT